MGILWAFRWRSSLSAPVQIDLYKKDYKRSRYIATHIFFLSSLPYIFLISVSNIYDHLWCYTKLSSIWAIIFITLQTFSEMRKPVEFLNIIDEGKLIDWEKKHTNLCYVHKLIEFVVFRRWCNARNQLCQVLEKACIYEFWRYFVKMRTKNERWRLLLESLDFVFQMNKYFPFFGECEGDDEIISERNHSMPNDCQTKRRRKKSSDYLYKKEKQLYVVRNNKTKNGLGIFSRHLAWGLRWWNIPVVADDKYVETVPTEGVVCSDR